MWSGRAYNFFSYIFHKNQNCRKKIYFKPLKTEYQTEMVKNCLSPVWNSQQQFDWHGEEIIRIDCWDHNKAEEKNNLYTS